VTDVDFTLTEEQQAIAGLAAQIFGDHAERVRDIERSGDRVDRALWSALAGAGLLGVALPEDAGGGGLGMLELCHVLEAQGRCVAPVPVLWTVVAAMALAEHGGRDRVTSVLAGEQLLTVALAEPGAGDPMRPAATLDRAGRISGTKVSVPYAPVASAVLAPVATGKGVAVAVVELDGRGVVVEPVEATDRQPLAHVRFDAAPATVLAEGPGAVRFLVERALTGSAALQVGVCAEALARAAAYTSTRQQFGKPLSTFQSTSARAADAYIDTEAMRATTWEAAWRLDQGLDASVAVEVAKWWAADAGERVVHATQHLHGGIGADVDYPIHRYFTWGKQLADTLGGASCHLARLGQAIAQEVPA
jgi:3-oxocholest-4-en-26-oyl-CoA dehydrogenase beta subunit